MTTAEKNGIKYDAFSIAAVFTAILLFFSEILFFKQSFFIGDIYSQFYPWKVFLTESVKNGAVPFWNPFVFSGVPFIADVQKGAFYPPSVIFFFFDFADAYKIYIIYHFSLMGLASFLLLREINFSRCASIAGTFIFLFNSFTVSQVNFLSSLAAVSLMPAGVLIFIRFLKGGRAPLAALFVIVLSLIFLSGHPAVLYYTLLFLLLYWIYHVRASKITGFKTIFAGNTLLFIVFTFFSAAFLTMPQSGLFMDYIKHSVRAGGLSYGSASTASMKFSGLLAFFMPAGIKGISINPYSDWIKYALGSMGFLSVTFVFLLFASFLYSSRKFKTFCFFIISLSLLLALGKNTPFHGWAFTFAPFYDFLRHPGLALVLILPAASFITAYSLDYLKHNPPRQLSLFSGPPRASGLWGCLKSTFSGRLAVLYIVMLAVFLLICIKADRISMVYDIKPPVVLGFIYGCLVFLFLFVVNILLYTLRKKGVVNSNFYSAVVTALIFLELFYFVTRINPSVSDKIYSKKTLSLDAPAIVKTSSFKFIHTPEMLYNRSYPGATPFDAHRNFVGSLPSNTGMLYRLNDAGGYDAIKPAAYNKFLRETFSGSAGKRLKNLNILNARYIISSLSLRDRNLKPVHSTPFFKIYKNQKALPLFFVTSDRNKLDLIMSQSSWTRNKKYDFSFYEINVNTKKSGYLVFSSGYFPGWKVYVDNQAAEIVKCLGIYKGVKLSGGAHNVVFTYTPKNLNLYITSGAVFAALFILAGALFIILSVTRGKTRRP